MSSRSRCTIRGVVSLTRRQFIWTSAASLVGLSSRALLAQASGAAFGTAVQLATQGALGDLATGPNGEALAVWSNDGAIEASFRPSGAAFGVVETVTAGHQGRIPAAAFDAE